MNNQNDKKAMLAELQTFELLGVQSRADAYRLSDIARKLNNISVRYCKEFCKNEFDQRLTQHLKANANDLVWQANALLGSAGYTVMYNFNPKEAFQLIKDALKTWRAYRANGGEYTFWGYWFANNDATNTVVIVLTEEDCK